jgi:hypothetical protein
MVNRGINAGPHVASTAMGLFYYSLFAAGTRVRSAQRAV